MAKKLTDEKLQVSIVINGNQAQNELYKLEKETRKLNESQKELRSEKKKLEQQGKTESARYKEVTASIKQNTEAINANKARMSALQKEIGLTGLTMAQLQTKATQLRIVLRNLIPGSEDYKRYQAELNQVNARLSELRGKANQAKFSLGGLADGFNRYQALAFSVIASLTGIVLSIQKIIDINGKLSDAQADVMKTTGMNKQEVDELTKSFGLMKTRTARIELLKLAEEGGRLGIEGVANIKAFVNVANQLKVALGDDLSETQIREVGKMVEVYKVGEQTGRDFEKSMLSLGSAINEVSASGSNQAGFLVEFLKRTAGISNQVKLSAADNIGYAATFDEIGQTAEVTGTVMNKIWMDMATDASTYAKIAGMSTKDFSELLSKDANAAMIAFLKGLNGNNEGLQIMVQKLKDIEVGGARGAQALAAISGNLDKLETRQRTANEALWEATSLTDEYTVKNENLAATLEKISKKTMGWFSSEGFINWLGNAVNKFAILIGATDAVDEGQKKWRNTIITVTKVLLILIASILSYNAGLKLATLWNTRNTQATLLYNVVAKARAVIEAAGILRTQAWAAATMLMTGNVKGATQALRVMNTVIKANPFGLLLGVIMAVAGAIYLFRENTEKAITSTKVLADVQGDVNRKLEAEKDHLNNLLAIARDEAQSKENRLKAIKEINEISPEYLGNITLENINTIETTASIYKYLDALNKKIKLQLIENEIQEANRRLRETEKQDLKEYSKWYDGLFSGMVGSQSYYLNNFIKSSDRKNSAIRAEKELIKELNEEWKKVFSNNSSDSSTSTTTTSTGPTEEELKKAEALRKKREAEFKKLVEDLKKQKEQLQSLEDEAENERLSRLEDGYEKERAILNASHERKLRDLKTQLISEADIQKAQEKSENTNLSKEERSFWLEQKEVWLQKNEAINKSLTHEEYMLGLKLATIQEKFFTKAIKDLEAQYNREKLIRETAYLNELNEISSLDEAKERLKGFLSKKELYQIKNLEQAKKELIRVHQEAELKQQEEFILQQIEQYEKVLAGAPNALGIDFNILTDEQKENFRKDVEYAKNKLAELQKAKDEVKDKEKSSTANALMEVFGDADVLGFTQSQWDATFQNLDTLAQKLKAADMIVGGLRNLWGQYHAFLSASENASLREYEDGLEIRKSKLKRQLDQGYISQVQYRNGVKDLENDLARQRAELEYKQAKRQRDMAVVDAIVNTARGVTAALGMLPPASFIFAGLSAAMGALQVATIKKQPLPARGFESGLYPDYVKREQDGKIFKSKFGGKTRSGLVTRPTYFLAGEHNKPEMIIDNATYKRLDPELRNALIRELRGIKGFEGGLYSPETQRIEIPKRPTDDVGPTFTPEMLTRLILTLDRTNDVLETIETNGIPAYMDSNDYKSIRKLRDATKKLEKVEQKAKL